MTETHLLHRKIDTLESKREEEEKALKAKELLYNLPSSPRRNTDTVPKEEDPDVMQKHSYSHQEQAHHCFLGGCACPCLLPDPVAGLYPKAPAVFLKKPFQREGILVNHECIASSLMFVPSALEIPPYHSDKDFYLTVLRTGDGVGIDPWAPLCFISPFIPPRFPFLGAARQKEMSFSSMRKRRTLTP